MIRERIHLEIRANILTAKDIKSENTLNILQNIQRRML